MNNMLQAYIRMFKEGFNRTVPFVTMEIHPDASCAGRRYNRNRTRASKPPLI